MNNRPKKRIAIIDYDNCAFTAMKALSQTRMGGNPHSRYLSTELLRDLAADKFDGFYGCTHRITGTAFMATFPDKQYFEDTKICFQGTYNYWQRLTTSITDNLASYSGLPCIAVSTPDDFAYSSNDDIPCGNGYREHMTKYEAVMQRINQSFLADAKAPNDLLEPEVPDQLMDFYKNPESKKIIYDEKGMRRKDDQLRMIMQHARQKFPQHDLEFVLYDDDLNICRSALAMSFYGEGLTLEIKRHHAIFGVTEFIGKVQSKTIDKNTLFAAKTDVVTSDVSTQEDIKIIKPV